MREILWQTNCVRLEHFQTNNKSIFVHPNSQQSDDSPPQFNWLYYKWQQVHYNLESCFYFTKILCAPILSRAFSKSEGKKAHTHQIHSHRHLGVWSRLTSTIACEKRLFFFEKYFKSIKILCREKQKKKKIEEKKKKKNWFKLATLYEQQLRYQINRLKMTILITTLHRYTNILWMRWENNLIQPNCLQCWR